MTGRLGTLEILHFQQGFCDKDLVQSQGLHSRHSRHWQLTSTWRTCLQKREIKVLTVRNGGNFTSSSLLKVGLKTMIVKYEEEDEHTKTAGWVGSIHNTLSREPTELMPEISIPSVPSCRLICCKPVKMVFSDMSKSSQLEISSQ